MMIGNRSTQLVVDCFSTVTSGCTFRCFIVDGVEVAIVSSPLCENYYINVRIFTWLSETVDRTFFSHLNIIILREKLVCDGKCRRLCVVGLTDSILQCNYEFP